MKQRSKQQKETPPPIQVTSFRSFPPPSSSVCFPINLITDQHVNSSLWWDPQTVPCHVPLMDPLSTQQRIRIPPSFWEAGWQQGSVQAEGVCLVSWAQEPADPRGFWDKGKTLPIAAFLLPKLKPPVHSAAVQGGSMLRLIFSSPQASASFAWPKECQGPLKREPLHKMGTRLLCSCQQGFF